MSNPKVKIDLKKIEANTKTIVDLAVTEGIEIFGVTKVVCADLKVAQAMLAGGVKGLADSRIDNLKYLRENLNISTVPLMLLRIPMLSEVDRVVKYADISLNSELKVIKALNIASEKKDLKHQIILMIDVGDRREGIMPDRVIQIVKKIIKLKNIKLLGLGTNLACFGGVLPSKRNLRILIDLKQEVNNQFGLNIEIISGGNSSSLPLLKKEGLPPDITQLRVGETILIGTNVLNRKPFLDTYQDAFLLVAEIVELQDKPAQPEGERGQDAFGETKKIIKKGIRKRAIVAVGRQDVEIEGLTPLAEGIEIEGGSSDHLIIDVTGSQKDLKVGDLLGFKLNYAALLKAATSRYVDTDYI
ncbi:MAG: alanine/ornithine racemase family PLP-dependent enzyme [Firmicutes bacterium]|nr:alanine/ornithine racemase family PLP-dependent enzyme [Bacillota bacterium]